MPGASFDQNDNFPENWSLLSVCFAGCTTPFGGIDLGRGVYYTIGENNEQRNEDTAH